MIIGFMLGDEIVWNGISWQDLNNTALLVKSTFPEPFLCLYSSQRVSLCCHSSYSYRIKTGARWIRYYNEGGAPLWGNYNVNHKKTEYPHIPNAVDFVSTDDYGTINTGGMNASAIKKLANAPNQYLLQPISIASVFFSLPLSLPLSLSRVRAYVRACVCCKPLPCGSRYQRFIYPRLLPHQKVFVVPQAYAGAISGYCPAVKSFKSPTASDLAAMDDCLLNQTIGYLRWIDADDKIVGLDGFHLSTYGKAPASVDYGVISMPKTLECYMTLGDQLNGK